MNGWMIALYVIVPLVMIFFLVWFVFTLNSIDRGIRNIGDALWKMAKMRKDAPEATEEIPQEKADAPQKQLITEEERKFLKDIEYYDVVRICAVTKKISEIDNDKHLYKLLLQTKLTKPRFVTKFIDDNDFANLELDREYTRRELGL